METKRKFEWQAQFEQLEDRRLMSADPVGGILGGAIEHHQEAMPDFWIGAANNALLENQQQEIEQALAKAHEQTGLTSVRNDYGFTGLGQTVAVIDSGIAYDHYALGGGFGDGYRVVGGWDFSEGDANPKDDGPFGSHGTHVTGIVGADSSTHSGVAPDVDLVGLRVFDDSGAGYFSWVEDALQWVHDHRNDFENPITAVNLSLGVASWNADSIPSWATLEEEFALLEADGIFISVSAGNSYTSYNQSGLSYPAVSSHVVPVMSVDDNGSLSYFSQRHQRAIAAPGRTIVSTVPDYVGDRNGVDDDWASFSGTSMAAPYVAGASVIVREAMEFVGYAGITQDTIYSHMMDTADSIFDSATNQWYSSLNLDAAIDALMPTDEFGSSINTAFSLGTIDAAAEINGLIGTLDDSDYFTFTAGATGTVSFTASSMTHNLSASWQLDGGAGEVSGDANESFTFDVVAGEQYTLGFSSADGLGYYNFEITSEAIFSYTDLGAISFDQIEGLSITGEQWYRMETSTSGYVSVESLFETTAGQMSVHLFDANMQPLDSGNGVDGLARVDAYIDAGQELYVCLLGTNVDVDLRLSNLVAIDGTTVVVNGTSADDKFEFTAGTAHQVVVNGVTYQFAANSITGVTYLGGGGSDTLTMTGTAGDELASLRVGEAVLSGAGFQVVALDVENVFAYGGGGNDRVNVYDSVGDDVYEAWSDHVVLTGDGFQTIASGFDRSYAYSRSGSDQAIIHDSEGDDLYKAWSDRVFMKGEGFLSYASGFEQTHAYSLSGRDRVIVYDSAGDDVYEAWSDRVVITGDGFQTYASGFDRSHAYSRSGNDQAIIYDSEGDDLYKAWSDHVFMKGEGFLSHASGFEQTHAYSRSGKDRVIVYDSAGDDVYEAWSDRVVMTGDGFQTVASGFDRSYAYSRSGNDQAIIYGSEGDDLYKAWSDRVMMRGPGFLSHASGFEQTYAYSLSGNDRAYFYDSVGDDIYRAWSDRSVMTGAGFLNYAFDFGQTRAISSSGNDQAELFDSVSDDRLEVFGWGARLASEAYVNQVTGFGSISAISDSGGDDEAYFESADYLFDLIGRWS